MTENDSVTRPALQAFRKLIKTAAPKCKESMLYGMPTYALGTKPFASFNVEKNVLCMYILDMDLVLARQSELGSVEITKTGVSGRKLEQFNLEVLQEIVAESVDRRLRAEALRRGPMPRSDPKKAPGAK
ncbi:MAG: DUF1801 domain-containing protein [Planctomycetes bacterium]|nr:DUF1801 domain-containing protein [Planctomycetota bacterium]